MASIHDLNTLNGDFKNAYAPAIANYIPKHLKIYQKYQFSEADATMGLKYLQPVFLSEEHGATYAGPGITATLNSAITSTLQFAQVDSYQLLLRAALNYNTVSRSNQNAYMNTHALIASQLRVSHLKKLEAEMVYGQATNGWGTVSIITGNVLTITTAEFAPGIWNNKENIQLDVWDTTVTPAVFIKTVTIPPGVATPSIDLDGKTITVDNSGGIAVGNSLFPHGAFGNQMVGIHNILASTGTVFNIATNAYSVWKPTSFAVGGQLTFAKVNKGLANGMARGLEGEASQYVNPRGFSDLVNEIEGARTYGDKKFKVPGTVDRGTDSLMFTSASGASVEIIPHTFVKEGFAYGLIDDNSWRRVGSTDVTFELPGAPKDAFFLPLPNQMGYEIRSYSDFSLFCANRSANVLFTGIVNTL